MYEHDYLDLPKLQADEVRASGLHASMLLGFGSGFKRQGGNVRLYVGWFSRLKMMKYLSLNLSTRLYFLQKHLPAQYMK